MTRYLLGRHSRPRKGKGSSEVSQFVLEDAIHASENASNNPAHNFEVGASRGMVKFSPTQPLQVTLEPSSYSGEKFALYQSYEKHIHQKPEKESLGFLRFLVETPLEASISHSSE
jgi:arginine-tRNA-protein transferase